MQIGMIGLGRMGANMTRRLLADGHQCVVYDQSDEAIEALSSVGADGVRSIDEFIARLAPPRVVWLMVPAAMVDQLVDELAAKLQVGDVLIDGGNSHFKADIERAQRLSLHGILYLDVGTSGGVWGRERGYCLMIGGDSAAVDHATPIFQTLAPGFSEPRTPGNEGEPSPAEQGWLHCGPAGAGHFVKMVHNGIEYGLMAAYAEGFNILRHAGVGRDKAYADAETAPLGDPKAYCFDLDLAQVSEVWRRGSVIASWLLDLTAQALHGDPSLDGFAGRVSDSGEGRWTAFAAIETGAPAPVLTTALFERFASRGEADLADRLLSAMRLGFGGHLEKTT
ncbi:MAG: decarboxylating 6-phosphogluconate dehydrogenase [Chromatiaceae bacterium]|nr:decarboxylating 6-phosphogluconate dehydrogenase [Chromatiaceae bacterium]MCP5314498.1 decarboxylating 6-phosphogluconate dehydrogenase [Chromatiaceae bacterium]